GGSSIAAGSEWLRRNERRYHENARHRVSMEYDGLGHGHGSSEGLGHTVFARNGIYALFATSM
ncbi:MAG TPA: hypothetical protein VED66_06245, partial [Candidatus Sulfotelmatobacter sp.]|nr:hypothetical protein [Candidatus Sulfotelmatobacter sp.]